MIPLIGASQRNEYATMMKTVKLNSKTTKYD